MQTQKQGSNTQQLRYLDCHTSNFWFFAWSIDQLRYLPHIMHCTTFHIVFYTQSFITHNNSPRLQKNQTRHPLTSTKDHQAQVKTSPSTTQQEAQVTLEHSRVLLTQEQWQEKSLREATRSRVIQVPPTSVSSVRVSQELPAWLCWPLLGFKSPSILFKVKAIGLKIQEDGQEAPMPATVAAGMSAIGIYLQQQGQALMSLAHPWCFMAVH